MQVNQRIFRALLLLAVSPALNSCVTKPEIMAAVWLNNTPIPPEICTSVPALQQYGFYRRLNDGKLEFISFCNPQAVNWLGVHQDDFNRMMDKTFPKGK